MTHKLARIGVAIVLAVGPGAMVACDREDRADVREGVNEVEKEVDRLDQDGKDD